MTMRKRVSVSCGKHYESFDAHSFFGDTGMSHVMDTDSDCLYDDVLIQDRIGGYGV